MNASQAPIKLEANSALAHLLRKTRQQICSPGLRCPEVVQRFLPVDLLFAQWVVEFAERSRLSFKKAVSVTTVRKHVFSRGKRWDE